MQTETAGAEGTSARASSPAGLLTRLLASDWWAAGLIFVVTRLVSLAGAYSGVQYITSVEPERNKGWAAELALMWDAAWYAGIAEGSYHYDPSASGGTNVAFAPLYPFLVRLLSDVLRALTFGWDFGHPRWGSLITAGLLISNVAFYFALVLLVRWLSGRLGRAGALTVALAVASLPTAFFFSAMYTEGLFLLLVLGAFTLSRSSGPANWLRSGLVGMLATLTRFAGLLVFPALVVEYMSQRGWSLRRGRADVLWLALVPAGIALYAGFLWWRFGSPFVFSESQLKGWNHQGSFFLFTYWESASQLWQSLTGAFPPGQDPVLYYGQGSRLYLVLDLALPVLFLAGAIAARRLLLASEWVWLALGIVYPLSTNITFSMARYVLPLWPGLIWLGALPPRARWLAWVWVGVSLILLAWCSRIYGSARWIG
ncbi:MAG TPA: hypothetical protein VFR15_16915 [Chloroflexia bacterium]|nr:hypothetical protein [Chloroflexia bacterium]